MKYFVIEGSFKDPVPADDATLQKGIEDHLKYLQKGFDNGSILFSGPKAGTGGGGIVMKAQTQDEVEAYLAADPLKRSGIQDYRIIAFHLHRCQPALDKWFGG